MKKNLCIFSILFVAFISSVVNSAQSAAVEEQQGKEGESQQQLKDYITDCFALINRYRAKHGSGPLTLDGGLRGAASACARRYVGGAAMHSCPEARGLGENVASGSGGGLTVQQLCPIGVNAWYAENRAYNYNNPNPGNWQNTGHFTYMIWRSSTAAGLECASGPTIRCVFLVRPKGNVPNVAAYRANIGPPRKEEAEEKEDQLITSQIQRYNVTID